MDLMANILSATLLTGGSLLALIGAVGIIRLPDVFARMHAGGIIDTMGAGMILSGLIVQSGFTLVTVKLFLIIAFLLYTTPLATHALAQAALKSGLAPSVVGDSHEGDVSSKS
jgi:multicomponent Na+:H+ antiporter subunit G